MDANQTYCDVYFAMYTDTVAWLVKNLPAMQGTPV